jgi:hypothetical protein
MEKRDKSHILLTITILVFAITLALIISSFVITNPTTLGPGGVTFWFIDFMFMSTALITFVIYQIQKSRPKYAENKTLCYFRSLRSGLILGVSLTVLLALSSLRSLSWRDFLLFAAAVIIVEVLLRTRRAQA